ncbi:AP-4 complex accessory subunit Tepsin-like isoform X2 [Periplaneta americana]
MLHLISNGHISFRQYLRRNDSSIKLATMYNGPPDPLLGVTPYENVRRSAQELLDLLFNPALIQQDESLGDTSYSEDKGRLQLGGLGTTGSNRGKYEGFGSSPLEKEETIKDKMIDMLEKLMNPTDETAEKIKSALTSSPGNYEAVLVDPLIVSNSDVPSPQARTSVKIRAHVPGRAGGGWESEDDDTQQEEVVHSSPNSGSTVSVDSLEKIDPATTELTPAREYVNEFCSVQQWPVSLSHLNETCKKCATLNCSDILHALGNILLQSPDSTSDVTRMRALLMLEWFVRTDLITPGTFSRILSVPLNHVLTSESIGQDVKVKAQKVRLILDKLQPRRG